MINYLSLFTFAMILISHQPDPNPDFNLDEYKWERRILIIFSPDTKQSEYQSQIQELKGQKEGMKERHMLIVHVLSGDLAKLQLEEPKEINQEQLRDRFDIQREEFTVLLIGKDGGIKMKSNQALEIKDIFGQIDAMPMRQREMRNQ
mgnify:CR=1 FL=1